MPKHRVAEISCRWLLHLQGARGGFVPNRCNGATLGQTSPARARLVWDSAAGVSQAIPQQLAWIRPRSDPGDDNIAFTVRDKAGTPHVWLYGHGGHSGGQLPNVRSSPAWLNSTTFFYVEETVCSTNCALGPAWGPDGKTYTFDLAQQTETASKINQVYGVWPRAGQL